MNDLEQQDKFPDTPGVWVPRLAVSVLLAVIVAYALAMYFFVPRGSEIDELGLFNPVYMKLHYGRMTYPIYGYFHSMFVHPPLRYTEVAALMRTGMTLPYAEEFMSLLLTLAIAFTIALAKFDYASKLSLMSGFFAALVWMGALDERLYTLRPDTQLALAWFLGLILLQDGELRNWNRPRLFLGSFVITYASGLHYYGVAGFLGVLYYLAKAYRQLPHKQLRKTVASLLGGGVLFGIPYLILFVIPNWHDILRFSHEVQSAGGWLTPVTRHFAQYAYWRSSIQPPPPVVPLFNLLYPALYLKIPLFLVGVALLALKRELRGFAVASLPLPIFVFAYSQGKSAGYYLPELMIYFSGAAIGCCLLLRRLTRRVMPSIAHSAVALVFVTAACWATKGGYFEYSRATLSWQPLVAPMDIARACAKQLVGPNAFIGGRIGLWYISGAQYWHNIEQDLLWRPDISDISLPQYFSALDYVVEHNHMSSTTVNSSLESIPSWYVSGLLKLRGFVLNEQHDTMNMLIFDAKHSTPLAGYVVDGLEVSRFDENPNGDFVFGSRLCQVDSWPAVNRFGLAHFNAIYLPKRSAQDASRSYLPEAKPGDPQAAVVTFLMPKRDFEERRHDVDQACPSLATVTGSLTAVDLPQLLAQWRRGERPMSFYQSIEDRIAPQGTAVSTVVPLDLDHLVLAYGKAKIEGDRTKRVTTAAEPYSFAAALDITRARLPEPAWFAIRQRIVKGQIGIGILDKTKNEFITRRFLDQRDGFETVYLPFRSSPDPTALVIENGDSGVSSIIDVENLSIVAGRTPETKVNQKK